MYTPVQKSPRSPTPHTYQRGQRGLTNQFDTTYHFQHPTTNCVTLYPPLPSSPILISAPKESGLSDPKC